jgi:serine protease inhibitor
MRIRTAGRTFGLVALLGLTACKSIAGPGESELTGLPRSLSVSEQEVIRGSNAFAFDLLRETLRDQPAANVFISPLSASMALGMTLNGARGETFEGMRTALGFAGIEQPQINESYRSLIDLLLGLDRGVEMHIANSVWGRTGVPFHDSFLQSTRTWFSAEVATVDFSSPAASRTINDWVKANTKGRITSIVPDVIPSDMVMYLINAIYFKGNWRERFDRGRTADEPFTRDDGSVRPVRMMNRTGKLAVGGDYQAGVQLAQLPYGRGAFVMTLLVPTQDRALNDVIGELSPQQWDAWLRTLADGDGRIALPRFRLEYETVMNQPLQAMGMTDAFSPGGADFTGMSPLGRDIYISEVLQKTFVDVNEDGTEAAAATSVGAALVSAPPSVRFDRPFLVVIRERFSGTILFMGRIGDPPST